MPTPIRPIARHRHEPRPVQRHHQRPQPDPRDRHRRGKLQGRQPAAGYFNPGDTVALDAADADNNFTSGADAGKPKPWQDTSEPFLNEWELFDSYNTPIYMLGEPFLDFNNNGTARRTGRVGRKRLVPGAALQHQQLLGRHRCEQHRHPVRQQRQPQCAVSPRRSARYTSAAVCRSLSTRTMNGSADARRHDRRGLNLQRQHAANSRARRRATGRAPLRRSAAITFTSVSAPAHEARASRRRSLIHHRHDARAASSRRPSTT